NLYTELESQREASESGLRKDMFNSILGNILKNAKDAPSLDEKILQLELLTYNFHESLNLIPLCEYLDRLNDSITKNPVQRAQFHDRLVKMGKEVSSEELASLEEVSLHKKFVYIDTFIAIKNSNRYRRDSLFRDSINAKSSEIFLQVDDTS